LIVLFCCLQAGLGQSAEDYLAQANQLTSDYEWQAALKLLDRAAAQYPGHSELRLKQAQLAIRLGYARDAEPVLRRLLQRHPDDPDILRALGEAALATGDHSEAAAYFSEALERSPGNTQLLHNLSLALLLQGKKEEALSRAADAVNRGNPPPQSRRLYALLLSLVGQHEESDRQMKAALRDSPGNAGLLFELSENKRLNGQYAEALEYLDMASEADPENPLYYSALAKLYKRLDQGRLAEEYQEKADRLLSAFTTYARALNVATGGSTSEALELLQPAVRANPEFTSGKLLLADLQAKLGRVENALRLYQEVLRQDPGRLEAREKAAWIRTQQGDLDSALELLEESPQSMDNRVLTRAYLYMSQARWQKALDLLEQIEISHPLNHQLLKLMATCSQELGRTAEALNYLERARSIKGDDPELDLISREIRMEQAMRYLDQHKWAEAIDLFSTLAREDTANPRYLLNLAYSRQRSRDIEGAVRDYLRGLQKRASAEDSTHYWAQKNLAACLARLGRYSEAVYWWEIAVRHERSSENLLQLGICYSRLERNSEAELTLEEALGNGERTGELLYNTGVAKIRVFKAEEGWAYVREAAHKGYQPALQLLARAATRRTTP